jgi:hypothetical protein
MLRSHIALRELEETKDVEQRERLKADYELLERVLKDERLLGFSHNVDQFGGFVTCPLIQDIQDSKIFDEIYQQLKHRVSGEPDLNTRRDAEHLDCLPWSSNGLGSGSGPFRRMFCDGCRGSLPTLGNCAKIRRIYADVATSKVALQEPRADLAVQHRRWGQER